MAKAGAKCSFATRVCLYLAAIITGAIVAAALADIKSSLNGQCFYSLDVENETVGSKAPCEFIYFTGISSSVFATLLLFITIFNMYRGSWGKNMTFLILELALTAILVVLWLSAGILVAVKFKAVCDGIEKEVGNGVSCKAAVETQFGSAKWNDLLLVERCAFASAVIWFVVMVFLSFRFHQGRKGKQGEQDISYDAFDNAEDYQPPAVM